MNIIFGFGEHHRDVTKEFCNRLARAIIDRPEDAKTVSKEMAEGLGKYKDKDWAVCSIRRVTESSEWEGQRTVVAEGTYSHYRDDHPMSPDGFACLELPFCVTVSVDSIWGERIYVAA